MTDARRRVRELGRRLAWVDAAASSMLEALRQRHCAHCNTTSGERFQHPRRARSLPRLQYRPDWSPTALDEPMETMSACHFPVTYEVGETAEKNDLDS